jgi:hypothetical protein
MGAGPKFMAAAYKARLWTCASTISMASPLLRDVPREIRAQKRANIGHPNGPLTRTPGASLARGPSVQSRGPLVGAIPAGFGEGRGTMTNLRAPSRVGRQKPAELKQMKEEE